MDPLHSLRAVQTQQQIEARRVHVEAIRCAAHAMAAGDESVDDAHLLRHLDAIDMTIDQFGDVLDVVRELAGVESVTEEKLAALKAKHAALSGRFYQAVGAAKKAGISEPVRSNGFGISVLYEPLRPLANEMRAAEREMKNAEKRAFRIAELEMKLAVLLGEVEAAPEKPKRPEGGAFNIDSVSKRNPEDPSVTGGKVLRRVKGGGAVIVTERPRRAGDDGGAIHVVVR